MDILKSIIAVLQSGSMAEQIGLISGLLAIATLIGWLGKIMVARMLFTPQSRDERREDS